MLTTVTHLLAKDFCLQQGGGRSDRRPAIVFAYFSLHSSTIFRKVSMYSWLPAYSAIAL